MIRFLRGLFSAGPRGEMPRAEASVEYNGYTITPAPEKDAGGWRIAGTISKEIGGHRRVYRLDRADTSTDREAIVTRTIEKAKYLVDEQGDRIFGDP